MDETRNMKVVAIADLHCGHRLGLTPSQWRMSDAANGNKDLIEISERIWSAYDRLVKKLQPIDVLFVLGDCIEGKDPKSGGTELITADRNEQVNIAVECLNLWQAPQTIMVHGTPYHTGSDEDWETNIANKAYGKVDIFDSEYVSVNGLVFNLKHKVGGSSTPTSRNAAITRDRIWNLLWAERGRAKADVILRAHNHYFEYCGNPQWLGINMPALQASGSKYGGRTCSGIVDVGLVSFKVKTNGEYSWLYHEISEVESSVPPIVVQ